MSTSAGGTPQHDGQETTPARSALILQDLQNDALSPGGAFEDSGAPEHAQSQNLVDNVTRLATAARQAGVAVVHVHYILEESAPGLQLNAPLFRMLAERRAFERGTWGAAPVEGLAPQPGDHVVEKMRMNGFYGTALDTVLRAVNAETVIFTGAWTHMAIDHTARHAADAGYDVVVVSDGTSSISDDSHRTALDSLVNVTRILDTDALTASFTGR